MENAFGAVIKQIHNKLETRANNDLRKNDLTVAQIAVLMELDRATDGRLEMKQLERRLHVAQSTVTTTVRRLEQKGLVTGGGSASDKRVKVVHITPQGRGYCQKAHQTIEEVDRLLKSSLTEEEQEILYNLLVRVRDSLV